MKNKSLDADVSGIERIKIERLRQEVEEGFTTEHDDEHEDYSLALAAICFAAPVKIYRNKALAGPHRRFEDPWPDSWNASWDKRPRYNDDEGPDELLFPNAYTHEQRIDLLVKAGALIAAEIDRLNRQKEEE